MNKEYSIFICLTSNEIAALLHPIFKRKGWLKDVPNNTEPVPLDGVHESFEYNWEVDL